MNATETKLVEAHRQANPRSRAISILRYVRNGSKTRQMGCVLCGESGPTWCGNWPKTREAINWEREHKTAHGI